MVTRPEPWMMTVGLRLADTSVCLLNLGKYLEIDDTIVGVKYQYKTNTIVKGTYITSISKRQAPASQTTTKAFNNQVSLQITLAPNGTTVSVKVFKNGNMHMSGIKTLDQAIEVKDLIIDRVNKLHNQYDIILVTVSPNEPTIDQDDILYSPTNRVIGYKTRQNTYTINGGHYKYNCKKGYYTSLDLVKRQRQVLDKEGHPIGYKQLVLNKGNTRIYKNKKQVFETDDCVLVGDKIIGTYQECLTISNYKPIISKLTKPETRVIDYNTKVTPELLVNESTVKDIDVYTMFLRYNLGKTFNKQELTKTLQDYNYLLNKTSLKQSKVELVYKHNPNNETPGICDCTARCTCKNINFIFFETGKVSVYGIKSTNEYHIIHRVNEVALA